MNQASFLEKQYKLSRLEAQLLASRGVLELGGTLSPLLSTELKDLQTGANRVSQAISGHELMVVVADYDCDGATACAVMVSGLRALGAQVEFVVPDRLVHGYGISPSVVDLVRERYKTCSLVLTVDNGILGHAGIDYANQLGLDVVVTDHHLPGASMPKACAVINPARSDCSSGLTKLAGVSVALWLVLAVKKIRQEQGHPAPGLNFLLPYVAIGTVADMVWLDGPNRQLVSAGMDKLRVGQASEGIKALIREAGTPTAYLTTKDIGFGLAPRINAAGRLSTMDAGIELLLTTDSVKASSLAEQLTQTNVERKSLQKEATETATFNTEVTLTADQRAVVLANQEWHPGIVGLVASRLKEEYNLPVFVFSLQDGLAKGSGRSIEGFHLKDALEEVARRAPGILYKFGGHAMAAGATLTSVEAIEGFTRAFNEVAKERILDSMLNRVLYSDGSFQPLETVEAGRILRHPWGQGFEAPAFDDEAKILDVKPLGKEGKHWKIMAQFSEEVRASVVLFNHPEPIAKSSAHLYLQPGLNTWKANTTVQWLGRVLH